MGEQSKFCDLWDLLMWEPKSRVFSHVCKIYDLMDLLLWEGIWGSNIKSIFNLCIRFNDKVC